MLRQSLTVNLSHQLSLFWYHLGICRGFTEEGRSRKCGWHRPMHGLWVLTESQKQWGSELSIRTHLCFLTVDAG